MEECCEKNQALKASENRRPQSGSNSVFSTSIFKIPQMDCVNEVSAIQKKLDNSPDIGGVKFDLAQRLATISHRPGHENQILEDLKSIGLSASLWNSETTPNSISFWERSFTYRLMASGALAVAAEAVDFMQLSGYEWAEAALALCSIAFGGLGVYSKGLKSLVKGQLNINALMSIAVTGAFFIKEWPEAAMVMFLFSVAELIEARSFDRARNAFRKLMELAPETATVQSSDGTWLEKASADIKVGDQIRARPGERIALDGVISKGTSTINQAPITGESVPVEKTVGDKVFAGSINEVGEIEYAATAEASNSTLARIVETVDSAQGSMAPTQRFIDRFSAFYTPAIFFLALAIAIIPPLLSNGSWVDWLYKALVLLVIACPCALVISTPVTIVSGLSGAAKRGILIKGGVYLEQGRKLILLALDKTGTLTFGKPKQTDFQLISTLDQDFLRSLGVSLSSRSDHPVSKAIAEQGRADGISVLETEDFTSIAGKGTRALINGQLYYLANHRLIEELGLCSSPIESRLEELEKQGKTVTILASSTEVLAIFAVMDTVRPTSREAIQQLHDLGVKTMMLSGDNQLTANKIAAEVGVDIVKGQLLPDDKMKIIRENLDAGIFVGMVGDGINDAPALAISNIGFAMGVAGTDIAIETSDVAVMDDDLRKIPEFIELSKRTANILGQNIAVAISIKLFFLVLTLMGISTMWMAVFADAGASLIVVANGLRLARYS